MPDLGSHCPTARIVKADEAAAWMDGYRFRETSQLYADRLSKAADAYFMAERKRGLEAGRRAGADSAQELLDQASRKITALIHSLEREMALFAVDLAERIVGEMEDRDAVVGLAMRAIEDLRPGEGAVFHVASRHLNALRETMAALQAESSERGRYAVEPDPAAGPRDCMVDTSFGVINAGIEAQLAALRNNVQAWHQRENAP